MDDQLDKDLNKRIKEVFDNYEDTSAGAGWLELRKKFPEEKQRRGLAWLWLAAALMLLFLGAGIVWVFMKKQQVVNQVARHIPNQKQQPVSSQQLNDSAANKNLALAASPTVKTQTAANASKPLAALNGAAKKTAHKAQQTLIAVNRQKGNKTAVANTMPLKNGAVKSAINSQTQLAAVPNKSTTAPAVNGGNNSQGALPVTANKPVATGSVASLAAKPAAIDTLNTKQIAAAKKPVKTIEDMFAADEGKEDKTKIKADRKVTFGVYASTYFNYARSGNNQVNAGAGLTAAIPLAKNLKLVTGVSINQNSFDYNNSGVFAAAEPASLAAVYSNQSFTNVANNTPYSQSASLLGLDVPFNLQYQFNTRKNQLYVLGGFSSGTFINESYTYLYANGNSSSLQPDKGVNDFYFARTLNFAFGVGYPLGRNQIVIEPFFKYPLEGLGAEQLHFGASGINLKFNFSTKK